MQLVTVKTSTPPSAAPLLLASGVYLRLAQAIQIRDVEGVPGGGRVHAAGASLLQPQVLQDLVEARVLKSPNATVEILFNDAASSEVSRGRRPNASVLALPWREGES